MNELTKSGPFLRGSPEWIDREYARKSEGCRCLGMTKIPDSEVADVYVFGSPRKLPSKERLDELFDRQQKRLYNENQAKKKSEAPETQKAES